MIKNKLLFGLLILFLASCIQEELPVNAHEIGDRTVTSVDMSSDYRYQLFFDLESNSIVSQNLKTDWDLGFECEAEGWHVVLNSAKAMGVKRMPDSDFESLVDDESIAWNWDAESGQLDSTAIGNWIETNGLYLVDRGYDYEGQLIGLKKLQILNVNDTSFEIRFANLDGSEESTFEIAKNEDINFTTFSFENQGQIASVEPPKDTWDLMFTQYLKFYTGSDLPDTYLVSGVLLNRYKTEAYLDPHIGFEGFEFEEIFENNFQTDVNSIGHDWKTFNFDTGFYSTDPSKNYIIKVSNETTYKLHFIDFYDDFGQKGVPKFEFQNL